MHGILHRFAPLILNGVRRLENGSILIDLVPTTVWIALEKATALEDATHNFLQQGLFMERIDSCKVLVAVLVHQFCVQTYDEQVENKIPW
jgi:hypothetical protein